MPSTFTAFLGTELLAAGSLESVLVKVQPQQDTGGLLIFEDESGRQIDFDLRGSREEMLARLAQHPAVGTPPAAPRSGPGRPKLGVLSREVSLLPRHWDWLERHPKGISAALRLLVEDARKAEPSPARAKRALEAAGRFMTAMAGDRAGYEEATRALYAGDSVKLKAQIKSWPKDIQAYVIRLASAAADAQGL